MSNNGDQHDDLLAVAALHARDTQSSCVDVSAMIFPTAIAAPSEAVLASVSAKLASLVSSIEAGLSGQSQTRPNPEIWQMLARSGFLREPELIDFVLARVAEDKLEAAIEKSGEHLSVQQIPVRLLEHADPLVADAAQALLAADSLNRHSGMLGHGELRPELLHQLCWRIVAAMEIARGSKNLETIEAARQMLTEHDESHITQTCARKLVHFISGNANYDMFDPAEAGLHIFVAAVAARLGIEHDHVLRLFDAASVAPAVIMLRGCDIAHKRALSVIYLFKGLTLTSHDIQMVEGGNATITPEAARSEVSNWAIARAQFLLSGRGQ